MSKMMVKKDGLWTPMVNLKGDTGPLPANNSVTNDALVTDGAKTNTAYLMGNRLTATAEGEMISVDDSYPSAALSLTVDGKSTQDGTPTPDAPVEIESVENPEMKFVGKNLFDVDNTVFANGYYYDNRYGGAHFSSTYARMTTTYTPIVGEATYTLSYSKDDTRVISCGIMFYDKDKVYVSGTTSVITSPVGKKSVTFTTPSEARYIRFHLSLNSSNIQLELGSIPTDYEPYSGATTSLLPEGTSLRSLPDGTKDELYLTYLRPSSRAGWAWYSRELEQRITTKIFDGSESWILYSPYAFYKAMPGARVMKTGRKELLCDQYKSASSDTLGSARTGATLPNTIFGRNTERHAIIKTETRYDTVGDFTASLAENPIIIQYALATPQIIDLGEIELPIMQAGTTNIWTDPSTSLSVTYERDRNIVISKLEAAAADLATS